MKKTTAWLVHLTGKTKYTVLGVLFGLCFPIISTLLEIFLGSKEFTFATFIQVQKNHPVLWIVDTAPIILGIIFRAIGSQGDRLNRINQQLEEKVAERTARLEETIQILARENEERKKAEEETSRQKQYF
ncbi:MAG: hypothetical protein L3J16_05610, partial [Anaerolineales bacterium]|nr:hypothetical protein [Anaerolineales bacterium]